MKKSHLFRRLAFTLTELMIIMGVMCLLILVVMSGWAGTSVKTIRLVCANNLRQIGVASRIWESGNAGLFAPVYAGNIQYFSINNGTPWSGTNAQNLYTAYMIMSNELSNPIILVCPSDSGTVISTNFTTSLTQNKNGGISYFMSQSPSESFPQMFLAGDRNISPDTSNVSISGLYGYSSSPIGPAIGGRVTLGTNLSAAPLNGTNFGWTVTIHNGSGNVVLVDGSVRLVDSTALKHALANSGDSFSLGQNILLFP